LSLQTDQILINARSSQTELGLMSVETILLFKSDVQSGQLLHGYTFFRDVAYSFQPFGVFLVHFLNSEQAIRPLPVLSSADPVVSVLGGSFAGISQKQKTSFFSNSATNILAPYFSNFEHFDYISVFFWNILFVSNRKWRYWWRQPISCAGNADRWQHFEKKRKSLFFLWNFAFLPQIDVTLCV